MSIPTTFAPVYKQDFTLRPVRVSKNFFLSGSEFATTASGYSLLEGYYTNLKTPLGDDRSLNDPRNSVDGSYKHIIWQSINHMYYSDPYNPLSTFEHHNSRYTYKFLNMTASIAALPYMDYGDRIKKNSIVIQNGNIEIRDDGYGNLYDVNLENEIEHMSRNNLMGYWGFNSEFRKFKYNFGTIDQGHLKYDSYKNIPNQLSLVNNVEYTAGLTISGSNTGIAAKFNGTSSFMLTPNLDQFNFDSNEDFMISFWMYVDSFPSNIQALISKNNIEYVTNYGNQPKLLNSGQITTDKYFSASYQELPTDVYPYDLTLSGSRIVFKRSDGIRTTQVLSNTGSLQTGSWNHISATRYMESGSHRIGLYVNGIFQSSGSDGTVHPLNKKCLMFGNRTMSGSQAFNGYLDEVRIYNTSFLTETFGNSTFHENIANKDYAYNTSVVGNVFYRRGTIVLSSHMDKYKNLFSGSWSMSYNGLHTIYEYEVLCRVRRGDFNLSMNPSARKSPKSDQLIDEMTGSLLYPYATTIGLYNDKGVMVAIGKPTQPVQMRDDVDINFLIKWDV